MPKKLSFFIIILFFSSLLSGCYDRIETTQTAICAGIGIDSNEEGSLDFTVQLNKPVEPQKPISFTQQVENISTQGESITEGARRVMLMVPRLPLWSHADVLIIGGELAHRGLGGIADFFARNRNVRHDVIVLISPYDKPEQIFQSSCPLSLCSSRGIMKILEFQETMLGSYTRMDMLHFLSRLATPGIDPIAPQVVITKDIKGNNILTIEGMAVFNGDKMTGSLDEKESRGYRFLLPEKPQGGIITLKSPFAGCRSIDLEITRFKSSIKPVKKDAQIIISLKTEAELNILGIQGKEEILTPEKIAVLEKEVIKQITGDITACVEKAQKLNSDILGFGLAVYRYMPEEWEKIGTNWKEVYPEIDYEVEVQAKIKNTYLIHKVYQPQEQ
ncbi:germination protein, Ger(x)C family [Thermosyntropha lipolytica DSM 11003]|uniref:Germination protein, Ger(X)C family n=1 Tax=Thermosyntropha lipolytica DSM 11003 TaxID=1123382 RepID=A0A1M5JSJ6_9FIRM|nr:Ger(x)C family spore germination protein [Thermosyntropha lipolytica]SHG43249.1 germination protein, Ger(x)C family [Thermosyntropha lipolytica DSM 11003]